jgi:two-component system response regulator
MTTGRSILVVDDSEDDAQLTLRALRRSGITNAVHVACDGAEALQWLTDDERQHDPERPALVLLDLHMPRIDGFQVLERMRREARLRALPVVILTSSREEADLTRAYRLGANSYVRKPVEFTEFLALARDLGRYWLNWNELVPLPESRCSPSLD